MIECKTCGSSVGSDWRFCRRCGSPLAATSQDEVATRTLEPKPDTVSAPAPPTSGVYLPPQYQGYSTGGARAPVRQESRRTGLRVALVLIGVLLMGAAGGAAFFFFNRPPAVRVHHPEAPQPPEPPPLPGAISHSGASEGFTKVIPLRFGSTFRLTNVNGNVVISTWDEERAEVTARMKGGSVRDREGTRIKIVPERGGLSIATELAKDASVAVDYEITLPREVNVKEIEVINGDVVISGIQGPVKATTVNGKIHIEDVGGSVETTTVNGPTEIFLNRLEGDQLKSSSVNGNIKLKIEEDCDADVEIDSVQGRVSTEPSYGLRVEKNFPFGMKARGRIGNGGCLIKLNNVSGTITFTR
jgi:hypothetical protein